MAFANLRHLITEILLFLSYNLINEGKLMFSTNCILLSDNFNISKLGRDELQKLEIS